MKCIIVSTIRAYAAAVCCIFSLAMSYFRVTMSPCSCNECNVFLLRYVMGHKFVREKCNENTSSLQKIGKSDLWNGIAKQYQKRCTFFIKTEVILCWYPAYKHVVHKILNNWWQTSTISVIPSRTFLVYFNCSLYMSYHYVVN